MRIFCKLSIHSWVSGWLPNSDVKGEKCRCCPKQRIYVRGYGINYDALDWTGEKMDLQPTLFMNRGK